MSAATIALPPPRWTPKRLAIIAVIIAIYWGAMEHTGMRWSEFVQGVPAIMELVRKMFPPDWSYLLQLGKPVVETIQVGIIATVVGSILAVPLAFISAR